MVILQVDQTVCLPFYGGAISFPLPDRQLLGDPDGL